MAPAEASHFDLAVLGADDPLGETFLKLLEERDVPVGRLFPLVLNDPEGIQAFRGEEWPWQAAEGFDFRQVQAVVVVSTHPAAGRILQAVQSSCPAMPILTLDSVLPGPAVALARVLRVLEALGRVEQAHGFITLPAALAGRAGLEELMQQTRGLFNMESPDPEAFPLQIAFNLIPLMDAGAGRYVPAAIAQAVAAQGGLPQPFCSVLWSPVLYGATTSLHVTMAEPLTGDDLRQALLHQDGICLMESDQPAGNPTPATDSLENADIFLGQVGVDGRSVRTWLVYDPLWLEARQMVAGVENWIEKPANSVLT